MASAGTLSYTAYSSSQSTVQLENVKSVTFGDDTITGLFQLNMDATAQPQVDTITISSTLPGADVYYRVTIDDYTVNTAQTFTYFFDTASTDDEEVIAARLAALINASTPNRPQVSAKVKDSPNANQIDVSSLLPGTNGAFTLTVEALNAADNTAASGTPITNNSVAGSGTGRLRSVVQFSVELATSTATSSTPSNPELRVSGTWYNGADPAVSQSTISSTKFTGPLSLDALRAVS